MDCCVFVHFGQQERLPKSDLRYILELSRHFSKIILVTNQREFQAENFPFQLELIKVRNEGYDFGMFYKVFKTLNWKELDRLALVNDSNILLGDLREVFRKGENFEVNFWGLIDSNEKPWFSVHSDNYHLQSHFLVWEKGGLPILSDFFDQVNVEEIFAENNPKELRRKVINAWEIGLSQYFLSRNSIPNAIFRSKDISKKIRKKETINLTMKYPEVLLSLGYPLIKKKYIQKKSFLVRLLYPSKRWEVLVKKYLVPKKDLNDLMSEFKRI